MNHFHYPSHIDVHIESMCCMCSRGCNVCISIFITNTTSTTTIIITIIGTTIMMTRLCDHVQAHFVYVYICNAIPVCCVQFSLQLFYQCRYTNMTFNKNGSWIKCGPHGQNVPKVCQNLDLFLYTCIN